LGSFLIVSNAAANKNLHVEYTGVTITDDLITIQGITVQRDDTVLATLDTLEIRVLGA